MRPWQVKGGATLAFWELVMDISTARLWMLCSQIMLGVVHGVKTSGCGIRDSLTLLFSGKGERLAGHAHTHVCVCVRACACVCLGSGCVCIYSVAVQSAVIYQLLIT